MTNNSIWDTIYIYLEKLKYDWYFKNVYMSIIETNVVTDEGNSWNEIWHWVNDEIVVAVQG